VAFDVVFELGLEGVEGQIPVFGGFQHGRLAAKRRAGVDEFGWQRSPALLQLLLYRCVSRFFSSGRASVSATGIEAGQGASFELVTSLDCWSQP